MLSFRPSAVSPTFAAKIDFNKEVNKGTTEVWCNILLIMQQIDLI